MPVTPTSTALESIVAALSADTGLAAGTSAADFAAGIAATRQLNDVLGQAIEHFGFNADKKITPEEIMMISDYVRATPLLHYNFLIGHGDDAGNVETGFHKLQNDGGNLLFQGRNMVDTVIDAIFHYGEEYGPERFLNEDGNQNERIADVAGWLNYFLNGRTVVFGSAGDDQLGSGDYTGAVATGAHETFEAGAGNDTVWAYNGNDLVYLGVGDDTAGGGNGNDQMWGDDGADTLYGELGTDKLFGGNGFDQMGGGEGNDEMSGDAGNDVMWGDEGDDLMSGGIGNDTLGGGIGHDTMTGNDGDDILWGDDGNDIIDGGTGHDDIGGGDGRNTLTGGDGNDDVNGGAQRDVINGGAGDDSVSGNGGNDWINGGDGNDEVHGSDGADRLLGGNGNDIMSAGEGADWIRGGVGADTHYLWDADNAVDTLIFGKGDSGRTLGTLDVVEGFEAGEDKIDLSTFGPMTFEELDFIGDGAASCYYDGRYLRIDENGDRATDMIISFKWMDGLTAGDFIFA